MKWHRVQIDVPAEHADFAGDVLWQIGSRGVEYIDPCDLFWRRGPSPEDEIETARPSPMPESPHVSVIGYFAFDRDASDIAAAVRDALRRGRVPVAQIGLELMDDSEWQDEWKRGFQPLRLSERITVVPAWEQVTRRPGEIVVRLDPGMAFGTGSHPTTVMCARMLERSVRPGCRVLDLGTGSGVLAILSAFLGSAQVTAVDIDAVAVEKAMQNVELNELTDVVAVRQGDLVEGIEGSYDVVVANIVADVIIRLLPDVNRVLAPDGKLIVSGIIEERKDECLGAALAEGLEVVEVHKDGEWVGALLRL
ncbi:MAG: 50S ribosomal protein L11 methyltransferase [Bacillota bacterium]|jgi:ribosomal protein L11 methyltransferase|nr:50S ribosomal protein L11 methyltransferase [Bacillota bacterium]HOB90461.1 50S ribosomal protein L11 methyltransferase [Bacillota bacterium]HPZ53799.1 50S ribosomal protein L11 methyltransferase [Bacillota bacterium]HQD17307.1 50S ribosomal protein L11 methyltransferase [Bacillota bacterium]